jgi:two-component system, OmpR family, alkaline phosphatase synthesis response regulator PhoP
MMWPDKEKLLIVSYNQHFMSEFNDELSTHFEIERANSEQVAFFLIREANIRMVIIDFDTPIGNVVQTLRKSFGYTISLIGFGQSSRTILENAFRAGCDYYDTRDIANALKLKLTLFSLKKRLDRTQAINQRQSETRKDTRARVSLGPIEIFPNDYLVQCNNETLKTTPIQFKLILSFLTRPDELLTRQWLQENIWDGDDISHRSIDAHISKLKKTLPELTSSLINIYGKGYMLSSSALLELGDALKKSA